MVEETLKEGSLLILNSDRISHHMFKKKYANVCSSHSRIFLLLVCKESARVCFYIYWKSIAFQTWIPNMGAIITLYFVLGAVVGCRLFHTWSNSLWYFLPQVMSRKVDDWSTCVKNIINFDWCLAFLQSCASALSLTVVYFFLLTFLGNEQCIVE